VSLVGGEVYIFEVKEDDQEPWTEDNLKWKSINTQILPKNKRPQVIKRSYHLFMKVMIEMITNVLLLKKNVTF